MVVSVTVSTAVCDPARKGLTPLLPPNLREVYQMFNSYNSSSNQSININSVTGAILKNHQKSWFERLNLNSERAKKLLTEGGHKSQKSHLEESEYLPGSYYRIYEDDKENDIIVLQMVICGDMEVIAECVHRKDYEIIDTDTK